MASPIVTLQITKDGDAKSVSVTITGGGGWQHVTDSVAGSTTDRQIDISIIVARLKAAYIVSDQDLTLEANSGSAPAYTLTLTANKPLVWYLGCGLTNPLTTNTTALFATNAGGTAAALDIFIEQDPTSA